MKNQNWQPKDEASNASMGRDEQSRVTSPSLDKLSELDKLSVEELNSVVGGLVVVVVKQKRSKRAK